MNKVTVIAAAAMSVLGASVMCAQDVTTLSVSTTWGFESAYIFRGAQLGDENFQPALDVSYGGFYAGVWAALPITNGEDRWVGSGSNAVLLPGKDWSDEVDFYLGYGLSVTDVLSLDFGVTYYTYPEDMDDLFDSFDKGDEDDGISDGANTLEPYIGISADVLLQPSLYLYYDIDLENFTAEVSVGHTFEVADKQSIEVGAFAGWVMIGIEEKNIGFVADDPSTTPDDGEEGEDSYGYVGLSIDYVYSFTENVSASLGIRGSYASEELAGDAEAQRDGDLEETAIWFGAAVNAGF